MFMIPRLIIYFIAKFESNIFMFISKNGKNKEAELASVANLCQCFFYVSEVFGCMYVIYMQFRNLQEEL